MHNSTCMLAAKTLGLGGEQVEQYRLVNFVYDQVLIEVPKQTGQSRRRRAEHIRALMIEAMQEAVPEFATKAAMRTADPGKPLGLDALAFAGVGEFVRQWVLVNRRQPFRRGTAHRLLLSSGGNAGHGGQWQ